MTMAVQMLGVTKTFSGVKALDRVTLEVTPGEVHALLGENGAGKSTLMKILSGAYEPTSGEIIVHGKKVDKLTPKTSTDLGISIIYQELSVINQLTVWENIFVGRLSGTVSGGIPRIDRKGMRARTRELLDSIGLQTGPDAIVGQLTISQKQMVEILRAVAFDSKIIVMDEPTTSLSAEEVQDLTRIVRKLREDGRSIIYISHKLEEIIALADRVTVLKDGVTVGTRQVADVSVDDLVTMMVGRELKGKYLSQTTEVHGDHEVILSVRDITRADGLVSAANFDLHKHEILGFYGLVGAGRTELMEAVFGAAKRKRGEVRLDGETLHINNPRDAIKSGIALLTENRRESGIFQNFNIRRNIGVAAEQKRSRAGGLLGTYDRQAERAWADNARSRFQIKMRNVNQNIAELSGGNQQKVLLGRWANTNAKVYIFDEPTKGIDVGTKAEIYRILREFAAAGIGVIVVSSELPEILSTCDRILVMAHGRICAEFRSDEATEEKIVKAASA